MVGLELSPRLLRTTTVLITLVGELVVAAIARTLSAMVSIFLVATRLAFTVWIFLLSE